MFNNVLSEKRAVYETMWKIIRPQMTI